MLSIVSLVLFASLSLMIAGLVLLVTDEHAVLHEPSPAELSTSAPAVRGCWERIHGYAQRRRKPAQPRRQTRRAGPREAVLEMAEISAGRTLLAGRISALCSRSGT